MISTISLESRAQDPAPEKRPAVDLTGVWAQKMVLTAVSDPPIVGDVTTTTTTYLRVVIAQDKQGALTLKSTVCDISIKSDFDGIRTVVPDRFISALPETTRAGKITRSELGPVLKVAPHTDVIGANLRQPQTEHLPTRADDFRVTDPDKDQQPGITIRIEGLVDGDIYVVQRGRDAYAGRIVSDDRIRGSVQWSAEQVVLDSTSIFLGDPPPTRPHDDPSRSSFEMTRLNDTATCSRIASKKNTLFR